MILTLKELAEYLRVNERTILRMVDSKKIPGTQVGGQWRFNGKQIDQIFFPETQKESPLETDEESRGSIISHPQIGIPLSRLMSEDRILLNLKSTTVEGVINELTDSRMLNGLVLNISDLREKCLQREMILSTGVGEGIAIPHPRDPISTLRASAVITYGYSEKGIDFNAVDGQPVHYFFLVCSQSIELHLHLMGRMARLLRNKDFMDALPTCKKNADVIKLVIEQETKGFLKSDAQ